MPQPRRLRCQRPPVSHAPVSGKMSRESVTVIVTLLVATFVVILNETIMNVALQRLMTDLQVSASTVQWLATGFMLTMAVVIPPPLGSSCSG